MVRQSYREMVQASTQKSKDFLQELKFDSTKKADARTIYIPYDENGIVLFQFPFHSINRNVKPTAKNNKGVVNLPKKDGSTFTPFQIGCNHHLVESDPGVRAEKKAAFEADRANNGCPICNIYYAERKKRKDWIAENYPKFGEMSKEEMRDVYSKYDNEVATVKEAYSFSDDKGLYVSRHNKLLVAELQDDGSYEFKIWQLSDARLRKINEEINKKFIDKSLKKGAIENLSGDDENPMYDLSGLELVVVYPKSANKAQAGRDASFSIVINERIVDSEEGLLEKINEEAAELASDVEAQVMGDLSLKPRTAEELMDVINKEYYDELMEKYGFKSNEDDSEDDEDKAPEVKRKGKATKEADLTEEEDIEESIDDIFK